MRAPKRKRPPLRRIATDSGLDCDALAKVVTYVGSPEHKDYPSFAGHPRPRADAAICDQKIDQSIAARWLKEAMRKGAIGSFIEGGFPRYLWYKEDGIVYEARLVNKGRGQYKGYPLLANEWPHNIETLYE